MVANVAWIDNNGSWECSYCIEDGSEEVAGPAFHLKPHEPCKYCGDVNWYKASDRKSFECQTCHPYTKEANPPIRVITTPEGVDQIQMFGEIDKDSWRNLDH